MLKCYPGHFFRPEKKDQSSAQPAWQKLDNRDNIPTEDSSWTTEEHYFSPNCEETKSSMFTNRKRKQKHLSQGFEANLECNKIKECKIHCRQRGQEKKSKQQAYFMFLTKQTALAFAIIFTVVKCLKVVNSKRNLK